MAQTPPPGDPIESDLSDIYSPPGPKSSTRKTPSPSGTPRKRKHGSNHQEDTREKRQKTQTPVDHPLFRLPVIASLPCELWQRIFCFLPPRTLPQLLWTCKSFNRYLTDAVVTTAMPAARHGLRIVHPDKIWQASRRSWLPSIPASSPGVSEPDLFKLLGRTDCQFCGKPSVHSTSSDDPWSRGPALDGVRLVWPFMVRSCGLCLAQQVQSEKSLMLSEFSGLLGVVPFVFLTKDQHVLSPFAFRSVDGIPQNIVPNKVFLISQLKNLHMRLICAREKSSTEAMSLLSAAATEQSVLSELFEAWEEWETTGGIELLRHDDSGNSFVLQEGSRVRPTTQTSESSCGRQDTIDSSVRGAGSSYSRGTSVPQRPPTRTRAGAEEAKAIRRAEIERRCAALEPPIHVSLLEHMDSFKAAMQISMPLTDEAWEMLKPKLISQRDMAQRREADKQAAAEALRPIRELSSDGVDPEKIKERWETFQKPIRDDLGGYVDELVRTAWADGRAINRQTAPRFAADALVFARNRYTAAKPQNMQQGSAFRLVLHNMKWLYETKIKPLTESEHGVRDCFRCAACAGDSKAFAFDSLIQHYAAKHTNAFSSNNTNIAWYEALWPEQPPFQTQDEPSNINDPQEVSAARSPAKSSPWVHPVQAWSEPFALYQPVAAVHRPPLTSPGLPPDVSGHHVGYHTPAPSYPSLATSPAFSVGTGYGAPSRLGHGGAGSPIYHDNTHYGPGTHTPMPGSVAHRHWGPPSGHPPSIVSFAPSPAQNQPSFLQIQMDEVANISREIWEILSPVKQIPPSVRMYTIIQHAVARFKERFSNEPNIDLYSQCVVEHGLMQPMRDANGLACKICVLEKESREEGHSHAFPLTGGERKLYSFYTLLWHFKNVHVETKLALDNAQTHDDPEELKRHDWKEDMIELPEDYIISGLRRLPGMTDLRRINVFKDVFPKLFEDITPEPISAPDAYTSPGYAYSWTRGIPMSPPTSRVLEEPNDPLLTQGFIKIEPGDPYAEPQFPGSFTRPREDEYDPSRPSVTNSRHPGRIARYSARPHHARGFTAHRGRYGGFAHVSPRFSAPAGSSENVPGDLLRSLTDPNEGSYQPSSIPASGYGAQGQYRRYDQFPPPPPTYFSDSPAYSAAYGVYSPPSASNHPSHAAAPEEDVEYIYVRRSDAGQHGYGR